MQGRRQIRQGLPGCPPQDWLFGGYKTDKKGVGETNAGPICSIAEDKYVR
jgi:hypothetical protein